MVVNEVPLKNCIVDIKTKIIPARRQTRRRQTKSLIYFNFYLSMQKYNEEMPSKRVTIFMNKLKYHACYL